MAALGEVLAQIKDNALSSAMGFRRNRKIHAGDLSDFHTVRNICAVPKNPSSTPMSFVARQLIALRLIPCGGAIQAFHVELVVVNQRAAISSAVGNERSCENR